VRGSSQSEEEELRERYQELLEEVRVVLPGVQVLFAFLLTSPFADRFSELDTVGVRAYAVALLATAASTIIFVAPTAYHRIAPRKDRRTRLHTAVRLVVIGLATLALAISVSVFVVARFVFGTLTGVVLGGLVAVGAAALWWALPRARRRVAQG
jgi:MFS family permease